MKKIVIRVQTRPGETGWWIHVGGLLLCNALQSSAVRRAVTLAREHFACGGRAQVVLHGRDGRIRWERSYPDLAPRRKG